MENTSVTGPLPTTWSSSTLRVLSVAQTQMGGPLPNEWALPSLIELQLSINRFSGTLPSRWATALPSLQHLRIAQNRLTGSLPPEWAAMRSLRIVRLQANYLNGGLPSSWPQQLTSIQTAGPCNVTCSGVRDAAMCEATGQWVCPDVALWYNCLDQQSGLTDSNSTSTAWNWLPLAASQQRADCPSRSRSFSRSVSGPSVSGSRTDTASHRLPPTRARLPRLPILPTAHPFPTLSLGGRHPSRHR